MKKKLSAILALCLTFCMLLSGVSALAADKGTVASSEEVIYAMLNAAGEPESAYSVAILNVTKAGEITHHGAYSSTKNLTDSGLLAYKGGKITATAPVGRFYYQGELVNLDFPWNIKVTYKLDNKVVAPEKLSGATGKVLINIKTTKNDAADATFFENYMLQVSVPLDTDLCDNIKAQGATMANSGGDKQANFVVMPGTDGDMTVTADAENFELSGITIAAVPYSAGDAMPDVSELTGGLNDLADGVSDLSDGVSSLSKGTADLSVGAAMVKSGAKSYGEGMADISANSAGIVSASSQIYSGLKQINDGLAGQTGGSLDLSALAQLPAGLTQLAAGLEQVSAGMKQLLDGYTLAYDALSKSIAGIPAASVSEADIAALMAANPGSAALSALIANYTAAQTVKGTWQQTSAAFAAVSTTLPQLQGSVDTIAASLRGMATQISAAMKSNPDLSGLATLAQGIGSLTKNYSAFHDGLVAYTGGVDALAENWNGLQEGVNGLATGSYSLSKGAKKLSEGAGTLSDETQTIPDEVDKMIGSVNNGDFTPQSFVSAKNTNCDAVQFVIKTAAIEGAAEEDVPPPAVPANTLWQRIKDLFSNFGL
ncbi:MAG: hypothetical protein RR314_03405 [Oscillospiraceae bacterium]